MTPRFPGYVAKIQESFDNQALMKTFGAEISEITPGAVTLRAPIQTHTTQQHGFAHAGLTFALGDSAAGYAALSLMEEKAEVLTVEMKINLLAPASGDLLIASGSVLKSGKRLVIVRAEVFSQKDGMNIHAASLQGTMIPVMP